MDAEPRYLTSVLVETTPDTVRVTFGLGDVAPSKDVEFFGYGVDYFGKDGNGGKRFGVRLSENGTDAAVFEWQSATQANYVGEHVTVTDDAIVINFVDASIGLDAVGNITAFFHIDGRDVQTDFPVSLLT